MKRFNTDGLNQLVNSYRDKKTKVELASRTNDFWCFEVHDDSIHVGYYLCDGDNIFEFQNNVYNTNGVGFITHLGKRGWLCLWREEEV